MGEYKLYSVCKVSFKNAHKLLAVTDILYKSGKDMAQKFDLHHWDNSRLKTLVIVLLCAMKNNIFLIYDKNLAIATFQTRKLENSLLFQKLATEPSFIGKGIGSFYLNEIEQAGKLVGCDSIICEVYDKSEHAINFYLRKGYTVHGAESTLKYKQLKPRKELEVV